MQETFSDSQTQSSSSETAPKSDIPILLIDDDASICKLLRRELKRKGIDTTIAGSAEEGLTLLARESFPVVVCDQLLPKMNGLEFVSRARKQEGGLTEIVILTGHGAIDSAIQAIKSGAFHYLTKPIRVSELATVIRNAHAKARLLRDNILLRREVEGPGKSRRMPQMIGQSVEWKKVLTLIDKSQATASPVLITGPSGTGKELVARAVHRVSPRRERPIVAVNCASVVSTLLESELFGHEAGAFTGAGRMKRGLFELADGGTLFLDEIGETSLDFQAKLLRVLETGEFRRVGGSHTLHSDVRIIAATNRVLKTEIAEGRFREDLYYRLNVLAIELPALKDRVDDLGALVEYFLALAGRKPTSLRLSDEALKVLQYYSWPGNIRELRNVVERLSILCESDIIQVEDLPAELLANADEAMRTFPEVVDEGGETVGTPPPLSEIERIHIFRVLEYTENNKTHAARILGITPATLYNKLKQYRKSKSVKDDTEAR